ncbi:hypothetical protein ACSSS7_004062 [Eimeria intestinalis]
MRLTFVPPALALCFITSHIAPGQSKTMLSGLFFGTNAPETPVVAAATAQAAGGPDASSADAELSAKTSGDLVPKPEVVEALVDAAQQAGHAAPGNETVATQTDARAAEAEAATEKRVSEANQSGAMASEAVVGEESANSAALSKTMGKREITEEDAAKNSELLQSVGTSAEASWISNVSKDSATEALLPLMALTPVLAAAGFHADIERSSSGALLVRFPSISHTVEVEGLHNYN